MITFLTYQLKVAVIMAVFYIFYRLFLIKDTWHRLNRIVLLGTALLSFLLPVCIITIQTTEVVPMPVARLMQSVSNAPVQAPTTLWWHIALMGLYIAGMVFVLIRVLASVLRVRNIIRHARKEVLPDGTEVYIMPGNTASFSWMGHIVISETDWNNNETAIISHEKAHVALHHSIDVLITDLITAAQWFNPAIWMLRIDLRAVHEYEADDTVLRTGTNLRSYQYLLISKAAAMNGYTIANNFNHSILKNRIFMMEKETSTRRSLLRALYLLPLVCICLALNAHTKVNYVYDNAEAGQAPKKVIGRATLNYDTLKYEGTLKYEQLNPEKEIMWDAEAYKLPEGKTVDELIKTLPGVGYDEDGNITVNGKPVSKVLVNGKAYNPNQNTTDLPDHTVYINSSESLPEYVSYSDTIVQMQPNGETSSIIHSGMYRPDAKSIRLNEDANMNMSLYLPEGMDINEFTQAIPGAEVDDNGNITVNGRPVSRVLVNGEELK